MSFFSKLFDKGNRPPSGAGAGRSGADDDRPFMEFPSGEYSSALEAMTSAFQRLAAGGYGERWITFGGQGRGHDEDSERMEDVNVRGNTLDLRSDARSAGVAPIRRPRRPGSAGGRCARNGRAAGGDAGADGALPRRRVSEAFRNSTARGRSRLRGGSGVVMTWRGDQMWRHKGVISLFVAQPVLIAPHSGQRSGVARRS